MGIYNNRRQPSAHNPSITNPSVASQRLVTHLLIRFLVCTFIIYLSTMVSILSVADCLPLPAPQF